MNSLFQEDRIPEPILRILEEHWSGMDPAPFLKLWDWKRVQSYEHFLKTQNEIGGFFSKGDSEKIWERHIFESMVYVWYVLQLGIVSRETEILDVGTGPGLPGMLFHCLKESPKTYFIDSQRKRLELLQVFYKETFGDQRSDFYVSRVEEFSWTYPIVISRAFIPFPFCAELASKVTKSQGIYVPFLGREEPISDATQQYLSKLGFGEFQEKSIPELRFLGMRHIKALKKTHSPQHGYPRTWKQVSADVQGVKNGKNRID